MTATGRCLCGAVTFAAQEVEAGVHVCHCSMCRRWSGGPGFAIGVGAVTFEGEENVASFESSAWAERGFCRRCGSHLFYLLKEPRHYILNMGAFDDQTALTVTGEIFVDEKPPGYDIAGEHPRLTGEEFLASLADSQG